MPGLLSWIFPEKNIDRDQRPLKILQVCAIDLTAWVVLRGQLEAMKAEGWDVSLACSQGPYTSRLIEAGIQFHAVPIKRSVDVVSHLKSVWDLYQIIKKNKYDVVNVHTPIASLIGRLAAKLAGAPLVIYTAHGFYFHENMPTKKRLFHVMLERIFGAITDHLFTVSSEDAETAINEKIMPADSVSVVGNGVDIKLFDKVEENALLQWKATLGIPNENIIVGIVGRLVEEKGFYEFFKAAEVLLNTHDNVSFLVVGGSTQGDRDILSTRIQELTEKPILASNVFFSGFSEEIPTLMNLIDVFVLPSHREGLPLSILEAMAARKPVVATNIRGCREEVIDGVTGFLVPVKDYQALADRIDSLLVDSSLRAKFGNAGRERVEKLFNGELIASRIVDLISQLLDKKCHKSQTGKFLVDHMEPSTELVKVIKRTEVSTKST